MANTISLQSDNRKLLDDMDAFISELRQKPKEIAEKDAKAALYRTGVTYKNGNLKKKIVSWE